MIITCEKCDTRFKLDDARISAEGVKVRCSRCKHAFRVAPPQPAGASDADVADALAREAVAPEPSPDEQTQALGLSDEHEDHTQVLDHGAVDLLGSARSAEEPDEESDWEFNEDPAEAPAEPAPAVQPQVEAPVEMAASPSPPEAVQETPDVDPMSEFLASEPGAAVDAEDGSLADLGSPEEWDLLGPDVEPAAASEAAPSLDAEPESEAELADAGEATGWSQEAEPEAEAEAEADADAEDATEAESAASTSHGILPESEVAELRLDVGPPSLAARATQTVAWAAVAGLLLAVAWASLRAPAPESMPLTVADLGVLQATELHAGLIENAVAGPLLVVSGQVRNPQAGPRLPEGALRVRLVDGSGAVLAGAQAWLAPAPEAAALREHAPQDLLRAQALGAEALAQMPLAPGESMPVAAVFTAIPVEARGFRLEVVERLSSEASRPSPLPASE